MRPANDHSQTCKRCSPSGAIQAPVKRWVLLLPWRYTGGSARQQQRFFSISLLRSRWAEPTFYEDVNDDQQPTDDYLPPRKQHLDDVIVTDPQLGDVPFWKALLWNTAHLRQAMMRADAVIERQRHHNDQPVKPSGSDESKPPPVATEQTPVIHRTDPEIVKALQHACDKLSARLDRMKRRSAGPSKRLMISRKLSRKKNCHLPRNRKPSIDCRRENGDCHDRCRALGRNFCQAWARCSCAAR